MNLDELLNLKFNPIHEQMKLYAKDNNVPIIQDSGLAFLETIIKLKRPKKILEIGTAIGYSATRMAMVENSMVITIERDNNMYNEALKNISLLGLNDLVKVIYKDALEAYDDVKDNAFDMIFIDAAKGQYINFFNLYSPLLKEDGIIVCDNMLFHGLVMDDSIVKSRSLRGLIRKLKNCHEFLLNHPNYDTSIFDIGDGMSVSVKKNR